jgi:hypothetical protein
MSFADTRATGYRTLELKLDNKFIFYGEMLLVPRLTRPPSPIAGEPPLDGYPWLLIQHIRSYRPYRNAVSSNRNQLRPRLAIVTKGPTEHGLRIYSNEKKS